MIFTFYIDEFVIKLMIMQEAFLKTETHYAFMLMGLFSVF